MLEAIGLRPGHPKPTLVGGQALGHRALDIHESLHRLRCVARMSKTRELDRLLPLALGSDVDRITRRTCRHDFSPSFRSTHQPRFVSGPAPSTATAPLRGRCRGRGCLNLTQIIAWEMTIVNKKAPPDFSSGARPTSGLGYYMLSAYTIEAG